MLARIENLVLDMDGVLWRGQTPVEGLQDFFSLLERLGIGYVLATNNAANTPRQYQEKLRRFGVEVTLEQILTSAEATGSYLQERYPPGSKAYVAGAKGLQEAMSSRGFTLLTPGEVENGARAPLVVVGFNAKACYHELAMGALLVREGAAFIGTNPDPSYPSELGPLPGAGALLAVISTSTGVAPTIIGKPQPIIFEEALRRLGGTHENTAMVGDRLGTDIVGARDAGLRTILVLSGISTRGEAEQGEVRPELIVDDIRALGRQLAAVREQSPAD